MNRLVDCHYCEQAVRTRKGGWMHEHKTPDGRFCPGSAMKPRPRRRGR